MLLLGGVLLLALASPARATSVRLDWDYTHGVTPAGGFRIQRGAVAIGPFATLPAGDIADPTIRSFSDTTVVVGTAYCYRVIAFAVGAPDSAPSNVACTTIPVSPPDVPTLLRLTIVP